MGSLYFSATAATAILVALDKDIQPPTPAKGNAGTLRTPELKQLSEKHEGDQGADILFVLFAKTRLYRTRAVAAKMIANRA